MLKIEEHDYKDLFIPYVPYSYYIFGTLYGMLGK